MTKMLAVLIMSTLIINILSFGVTEDKFIKKYAMMKIYESCFGPEVVKQIRKEMKAACMKCAAIEAAPPQIPNKPPKTEPSKVDSVTNNDNFLYSNPSNFNTEKLHQAILAYKPNPLQTQFFRPYPTGMLPPFYSQPFANPMFYPNFQQPDQFSPYGLPLVGQQFYGNRMSRDMDSKGQLEALMSKMGGRVRNVTCVMQELGYLDDNLEPDFTKINERISSLPVSEELRRDMQDGAKFCQQFAQCVPEVKKDKSPLSRELMRPMFFFKCYKHKKLEACVMKDVREKYSGLTDEEFDGNTELRRTGKSSNNLLPTDDEINELASSIYEFLYGSDSNVDIESIV